MITTPTTRSQATIYTASTTFITAKTTEEGSTNQASGLGLSDKIALGVGIGVGLPATLAGLVTCYYTIFRR